jgi:hypothetical protein
MAIGWSPATFWSSTALDLNAAVRGFNIRHGGGKKPKASPMTRDRLDEMIAADTARQAAKPAAATEETVD